MILYFYLLLNWREFSWEETRLVKIAGLLVLILFSYFYFGYILYIFSKFIYSEFFFLVRCHSRRVEHTYSQRRLRDRVIVIVHIRQVSNANWVLLRIVLGVLKVVEVHHLDFISFISWGGGFLQWKGDQRKRPEPTYDSVVSALRIIFLCN